MKCKLMIIVIVVLISMSSCQNQPKEEYIKEEFVKAVNEVIKNKKGIIDEAKKILDKLDNVDELKKELTKKEEKM